MEFLNKAHLKFVAGANANSGYSPDCAGGGSKSSHSNGSSRNGGGFNPFGNNYLETCNNGIIGGMVAGSLGGVAGLAVGLAGGAIAGGCFSNSNGGGGGSGTNNNCSGDSCSW